MCVGVCLWGSASSASSQPLSANLSHPWSLRYVFSAHMTSLDLGSPTSCSGYQRCQRLCAPVVFVYMRAEVYVPLSYGCVGMDVWVFWYWCVCLWVYWYGCVIIEDQKSLMKVGPLNKNLKMKNFNVKKFLSLEIAISGKVKVQNHAYNPWLISNNHCGSIKIIDWSLKMTNQ